MTRLPFAEYKAQLGAQGITLLGAPPGTNSVFAVKEYLSGRGNDPTSFTLIIECPHCKARNKTPPTPGGQRCARCDNHGGLAWRGTATELLGAMVSEGIVKP